MYLKGAKATRGFTLIEVIVSMAILGLVLSMAYFLMGFSQKSLSSSNDYYDIQNDIRLASGYLCDQVRYATELEIISADEAKNEISAHTDYDYFYIDNGSLHQAKYVDDSTYDERTLATSLSDTESYFSAPSTSTTLGITLTAQQDGKSYSVSTKLKLENFPLISDSLFIGISSDGSAHPVAIRYKTP